MGDKSKITWTEATWNPITGCSPVSPGCDNCYAAGMTHRFRKGYTRKTQDGRIKFNGKIKLHHERLGKPLHWKKPRLVFVCSMADLFHHDVPDEFLLSILRVMVQANQHTYQLLTKRPERAVSTINAIWGAVTPPDHIWLGVTAEDQKRYEKRGAILADCVLKHKWLSIEPMLGEINLPALGFGWLSGVVVGCESLGSRTGRAMDLEWVREIRDNCGLYGVPLHVKQIGINGRVSKDMSEWPEDLRIREWPKEGDDGGR